MGTGRVVSAAVATAPPADLELTPLDGEGRPLAEWLTTFRLAVVVIDPFTWESSWLLKTAGRVLSAYADADCRTAFLVTGNELMLAFFPNFLEPLFLVTASILAWERAVRHLPDWRERGFAVLHRYRWPIGIVIVLYKLQDEYVTHVGNIDRSDLFKRLFGG